MPEARAPARGASSGRGPRPTARPGVYGTNGRPEAQGPNLDAGPHDPGVTASR